MLTNAHSAFNSTLVSSGTSTQDLSSSAFSTFITSAEATPVPSSGSSSVSLDSPAVPVNRTQAITSAASTSFPVSSSGQSISSAFSVISESSAVPSIVSLSSSAATHSASLPIRPGDPIDTPETTAPIQRSFSSSVIPTSLVTSSSPVKSASTTTFARGVANPAGPPDPQSTQAVSS